MEGIDTVATTVEKGRGLFESSAFFVLLVTVS